MAEPFPLHWPDDWPRTPRGRRRRGSFKVSMTKARDELLEELRRLGARRVVVSTDIPIRRDGLFYASASEPNDPGVAVYFQWQGKPHTIACDSYQRVHENVRAVGKTVEALRAIARHGASQLLERAASGFRALPPGSDTSPQEPARPWWEALGFDSHLAGVPFVEIAGDPTHRMRKPALDLLENCYRAEIGKAHPDKPGGSAERTRELNLAIEQARRSLGG